MPTRGAGTPGDPQKLGSYNRHTWGAYLLNGELFVKRYEATGAPAAYPALGCSFETPATWRDEQLDAVVLPLLQRGEYRFQHRQAGCGNSIRWLLGAHRDGLLFRFWQWW